MCRILDLLAFIKFLPFIAWLGLHVADRLDYGNCFSAFLNGTSGPVKLQLVANIICGCCHSDLLLSGELGVAIHAV